MVALHDKVAPTDIEEGMRVGVERTRYQIHIPLPPKIDASVTMMQVPLSFENYLTSQISFCFSKLYIVPSQLT